LDDGSFVKPTLTCRIVIDSSILHPPSTISGQRERDVRTSSRNWFPVVVQRRVHGPRHGFGVAYPAQKIADPPGLNFRSLDKRAVSDAENMYLRLADRK